MNAKKSLLMFAVMSLLFLIISTIAAQASAKKFPVLIIGLEFPLTSSTGSLSDHKEFPASIMQNQTDAFGTRRVFNNVVTDRIFGSNWSVASYFSENSYNSFALENAGIFGPYQAIATADHYWAKTDKCSHGWTDGHGERRSEAIKTFIAEEINKRKSFDLSLYDKNKDGKVTKDELAVVVVCPQQNTYGVARGVPPKQDSKDSFSVGNISWDLFSNDDAVVEMFTFDFGGNRDLGLLAHELSHTIIDATDLYEDADTLPNATPPGWDPTAPGAYSLMDHDPSHGHLDPLHKINKANWLSPIVVTKDGYYNIRAVENHPDIYKLADPNSHKGEYFLVENRQRIGYDNLLPDDGLAIWHIDETRFPNWRTAIEMEPAVGVTNPIQWSGYLWSGSSLEWTNDSLGVNSNWHDDSHSDIGVWAISQSSQNMRAFFDVPGPGILVQILPDKLQMSPNTMGNYNIRLVNTDSKSDKFQLSVSGLDSNWVTLSSSSVTLNSYEQSNVTLSISLPKCNHGVSLEGSIFISVTAKSATDPKVSTTDSAQLVIKIPDQALNPDKYESNDTINSSTPAGLSSTNTKASMEFQDLTLHSGSDIDFFQVKYESTPQQENFIKGNSSFLAVFRPKYSPGGLSITVKEEYCRSMVIDVYYSNGSLYKTFYTDKTVSIMTPTSTFADKKLFLAIRNSEKKSVKYNLTIDFNCAFISLKPPLYEIGKFKKPLPPELEFFDKDTKYYGLDRVEQYADGLRGSIDRFNEYRSRIEKADTDHVLGQIACMTGRYEDAQRLYEQSMNSFREMGETAMEADVLRSFGILYSNMEGNEGALEYFNKASSLHERIEDYSGLAEDQMALGIHYMAKRKNPESLASLQRALEIQVKTFDISRESLNLLYQSDVFLSLRKQEAAIACLILAENLSSVIDDERLRTELNQRVKTTIDQLGEQSFTQIKDNVTEQAETIRRQAKLQITER